MATISSLKKTSASTVTPVIMNQRGIVQIETMPLIMAASFGVRAASMRCMS